MTLQEWRVRFTEANHQLWSARERYFERRLERLQVLLKHNPEALREEADNLRQKGIYSSKISLKQIEFMILRRLYRASLRENEQASPNTWRKFCIDFLGLGWYVRMRPPMKAAA